MGNTRKQMIYYFNFHMHGGPQDPYGMPLLQYIPGYSGVMVICQTTYATNNHP